MKLWQKGTPLNKQIEAFTVGTDYLLDQQLVSYDCVASIAHAKMLGRIGVLKKSEVNKLVAALREIVRLQQKDEFPLRPEDEDCHTAIENYLTQKLGDLGKKIHTGRSRNDQVLTALRLYYKDKLRDCTRGIEHLSQAVRRFQKRFGNVRFPGYTHTRKAMPSSFRLWAGSFIDAMRDDKRLLSTAFKLIDQNPLGSGAGYGVPLKLDRAFTTRELQFARTQSNPIYVQNSRGKFESTILHGLTQILFDLNKLAADLIFFSLPELGFISLPDDFCTGSSIMPQKKNPDVLELLRAQYHRVLAFELQLKTGAANLISGYHRDMQLTKEPVMQAFETTAACLAIAALLFDALHVDAEKCSRALTDDVFATERVYELVQSGVPFRDAYRRIAAKFR